MANRFDYVEYDKLAVSQQSFFKEKFMSLEEATKHLISPRAKALVLTKLEEAYMWVGKAIRDDQIERDVSTKLQEKRGNE